MAELGPGQKASKAPALAVDTFVNANGGGRVSPDGEYLAYQSLRTGSKPTLVVKTIRTGEERVVPLKPPLADSFGLRSWFPDGKSVLVGLRGPDGPGVEFYRVELETGKAELLHRTGSPIRSFQLSPNGKFIVYTEDNAETAPAITTRLVRFDLDTRRETELKKGEWYMGVGISPDSKQISYRVSVTPGPASFLAVMPAAGGAAREIYRASPWQNSSPDQVWTPDQQYIIFARQESGGFGASTVLWKMPVAGGAAEKIGISLNARLGFSMPADGKRLFLSATEEGPNEVWALQNFLPKAPEKPASN
jgi:Tol biopolymer transport system component